MVQYFCSIYASKGYPHEPIMTRPRYYILTSSVREMQTWNKSVGTFFPVKFISGFSQFFTLRLKTSRNEK